MGMGMGMAAAKRAAAAGFAHAREGQAAGPAAHRSPTALVCALALCACAKSAPPPLAHPAPPAPRASGPAFHWGSPNGWKQEKFSLPPKRFAPQLGFSGTEVLHFSPGYFKAGDEQFWTYAFALLVDEPSEPSTQRLLRELHTYFVGLGGHLGKHNSPQRAAQTVSITGVARDGQASAGGRSERRFRATVLDPWATGAPVDLNLQIHLRACPGTSFQAVIVLVSRHPFAHPLWRLLEQERDALRCGQELSPT